MSSDETSNLVWIDLEMTGLNPDTDTILEIACIITDKDLNTLEEIGPIIIQTPKEVLDNMNEWCIEHHGNSGLTEAALNSTTTMQQAEEIVLEKVKQHCPPQAALLCGNSVYIDRSFLRKQMPRLSEYFHYRLIDVSTLKELRRLQYPDVPEFPKQEVHRALDDIKESIAELKYYKEKIMK